MLVVIFITLLIVIIFLTLLIVIFLRLLITEVKSVSGTCRFI